MLQLQEWWEFNSTSQLSLIVYGTSSDTPVALLDVRPEVVPSLPMKTSSKRDGWWWVPQEKTGGKSIQLVGGEEEG